MNIGELTGQKNTHIKKYHSPLLLARQETAAAFFKMKKVAAEEGLELFPVSSFRGFQSQLAIWNDKCSGKKTIYDSEGRPMEISDLSRKELIRRILRWSALPGASRHHWGTDIDIIDLKAAPAGYKVKLLPQEMEEGGIFHKLHIWLDKNLERFGFFRPYNSFKNGVCPEPWHISFKRLSTQALKSLNIEIIETTVKESAILEKETILELLPEIYTNYIMNISS